MVKKIPAGKVTTYGEIARTLGIKNSRLVGWALHANKNPQVPCHRVVFKDGSLAPGYVFGGPSAQRKKLAKEGIGFNHPKQVKIEKYLWKPNRLIKK